METIYLDNAASTSPSTGVLNAYKTASLSYGNPSSMHLYGEEARRFLYQASDWIGLALSCSPEEIHFTSGATMSNNLFIQGFLRQHPNARLVVSTIEHNDIMLLSDYLDQQHGMKWVYKIPVDRDGRLCISALDLLLNELSCDEIPILCCIQWANGECGTIQNMLRISQVVHSHPNCFLYTDATQYIPYFKINLKQIQIDGLGMSGQKIHGLKGTGLLYVRNGVQIAPLIFGEQGLIGGTENVGGAYSLAIAFNELTYSNKELYKKRNYLLDGLKECGKLIGPTVDRLPNNVYICLPCDSETAVVLLNEFGYCTSSGSACGSYNHEGSHVVRALGYTSAESQSCVRFSISDQTSYEDLDGVIKIVNEIIKY